MPALIQKNSRPTAAWHNNSSTVVTRSGPSRSHFAVRPKATPTQVIAPGLLRQRNRLTDPALQPSRHAVLGCLLAGGLLLIVHKLANAPPAYAYQKSQLAGQDDLVNRLIEDGRVEHADVDRALRAVDRGYFCGRRASPSCYSDRPLTIGYGETISAPHMHATCLELLREHLHPGARVLDVGSGSGYLTAAMAVMVGESGKVVGIDKHPELVEQSVSNVRAGAPQWLDNGVIELRAGNVLGDALEGEEPFDVIHVGAAAETLPVVLVSKLKHGGRLVIPVGPREGLQVMKVVDKDVLGRVTVEEVMHCFYVPLTEPEKAKL